ncbi:MAG: N-acetyltransferase [Clostridiales bacterium]|nr:N-acetyltransferase [Clostridiales bacterium]
MSDFAVRPMTDEDWPDVARIYQEGMDTNLSTFRTSCPDWAEWDGAHLKKCRLVATRDGAVVGWVALSPYSSRCVYEGVAHVSVYIGEGARGMGAGKTLLKALIAASEAEGFWTLQSGIMEDNAGSIALHIGCGFRLVGYREKIGRDRFGVWRNTLLMERRSPRDDFADTTKETACCCG